MLSIILHNAERKTMKVRLDEANYSFDGEEHEYLLSLGQYKRIEREIGRIRMNGVDVYEPFSYKQGNILTLRSMWALHDNPEAGQGWEFVGQIGVDSAQLLLTDPCNIVNEWGSNSLEESDLENLPESWEDAQDFDYAGCCRAASSGDMAGQLKYRRGHAGAGVCLTTGYGDGLYNVMVKRTKNGRIASVRINFVEEGE